MAWGGKVGGGGGGEGEGARALGACSGMAPANTHREPK